MKRTFVFFFVIFLSLPFCACEETGRGEPPDIEVLAFPRVGDAPFDVTFTVNILEETDYTVKQYEWDFDGDGEWDETTSAETSTITHTYTVPGVYSPTAKVVYNEGNAFTEWLLDNEEVDDGAGGTTWSRSIHVN